MELARDIAEAIAANFSKPFGTTTFIEELPEGSTDSFVLVLTGGADSAPYNGGIQVRNFQAIDIYYYSKNASEAYTKAQDARKFVGCLPCLAQHITSNEYKLQGVQVIGGVVSLGKTAEQKYVTKITAQIAYLAAC